jgi:hypothetical protein
MNFIALKTFVDTFEKVSGTGWDLHGYHRDPDRPDLEAADEAWRARSSAATGPYPKPTHTAPSRFKSTAIGALAGGAAGLAGGALLSRIAGGRSGIARMAREIAPRTKLETGILGGAGATLGAVIGSAASPARKTNFLTDKPPDEDVKAWRSRLKEFQDENPAPEDPYDYRSDSRISTPFDDKTNYKLNANIDWDRSEGSGELNRFVSGFDEGQPARNLSREDLQEILSKYGPAAAAYSSANPDDPYVEPGVAAFTSKAQHLLKDPRFRFARLEGE